MSEEVRENLERIVRDRGKRVDFFGCEDRAVPYSNAELLRMEPSHVKDPTRQVMDKDVRICVSARTTYLCLMRCWEPRRHRAFHSMAVWAG